MNNSDQAWWQNPPLGLTGMSGLSGIVSSGPPSGPVVVSATITDATHATVVWSADCTKGISDLYMIGLGGNTGDLSIVGGNGTNTWTLETVGDSFTGGAVWTMTGDAGAAVSVVGSLPSAAFSGFPVTNPFAPQLTSASLVQVGDNGTVTLGFDRSMTGTGAFFLYGNSGNALLMYSGGDGSSTYTMTTLAMPSGTAFTLSYAPGNMVSQANGTPLAAFSDYPVSVSGFTPSFLFPLLLSILVAVGMM